VRPSQETDLEQFDNNVEAALKCILPIFQDVNAKPSSVHLEVFSLGAVILICAKHTFFCTDTTSTFSQRFDTAVVRCRELGIVNAVRSAAEVLCKDEHGSFHPQNYFDEREDDIRAQLINIIRDNDLPTDQ